MPKELHTLYIITLLWYTTEHKTSDGRALLLCKINNPKQRVLSISIIESDWEYMKRQKTQKNCEKLFKVPRKNPPDKCLEKLCAIVSIGELKKYLFNSGFYCFLHFEWMKLMINGITQYIIPECSESTLIHCICLGRRSDASHRSRTWPDLWWTGTP